MGTKVRLRPWNDHDLVDLVRIANNPNIANQLRDAFPHPYTMDAAREWIAFNLRSDSPTHFAIEMDGSLAGGIGYFPGRDIERISAEVGYWIGEEHWGRGLATEALLMLVDLIKERKQFARLFALPFASNLASRKVLEKAGFKCDAILRQSAIKSGQIVDQCLYSRLLTIDSSSTT